MVSGYPQALLKRKLAKSFRNEDILNASPDKLILKVYDHIIISCKKKDRDKAAAGLVELINSLNFDYEESASGLLNLYRYCLNNLNGDGFDHVADILSELKDTWITALNSLPKQNQEQNPI